MNEIIIKKEDNKKNGSISISIIKYPNKKLEIKNARINLTRDTNEM